LQTAAYTKQLKVMLTIMFGACAAGMDMTLIDLVI
jgi:hypothetical protein